MSIAGLYSRSRGDLAGVLKSVGSAWQQYGPTAIRLAQSSIGPGKFVSAAKMGAQGWGEQLGLAPGGEYGGGYAPRRRSRGRGITGAQLRNYLRVAKLIRKYAPLARGTPRKARRGR